MTDPTGGATWAVTWVPQNRVDDLGRLLAEGWEPFGVTGPSGAANSISPVIYLRRVNSTPASLPPPSPPPPPAGALPPPAAP